MIRLLEETIGRTAEFKMVWFEGKSSGFSAFCNNFMWSPSLAQAEPKLKELLEVEGQMRWYLDLEHQYWRRRQLITLFPVRSA
jgi:hypothetical protein